MGTSTKTLTDRMDRAIEKIAKRADAEERRGDRAMATCYRKDCEDLRGIRAWIAEGQLAYAADSAGWLDTAVREEIPASVWRAMRKAQDAAEAAKSKPRRRGGFAGGLA